MAVASEEEVEQLRGFSLAVLEHLRLEFPRDVLEPLRTTRSLRGLREAAGDGLPTLTLMRDRRYRSLLEILSRGRIASDEEFRLVNGFVSDLDTHLSGAARDAAEALMQAYEIGRPGPVREDVESIVESCPCRSMNCWRDPDAPCRSPVSIVCVGAAPTRTSRNSSRRSVALGRAARRGRSQAGSESERRPPSAPRARGAPSVSRDSEGSPRAAVTAYREARA